MICELLAWIKNFESCGPTEGRRYDRHDLDAGSAPQGGTCYVCSLPARTMPYHAITLARSGRHSR